jgi:alkylhydroperoxidase family enzyme
MVDALRSGDLGTAFTPAEVVLLEYAERLTRAPWELDEAWIDRLRAAGFDDGRILEANQVAAYFAYANRTVLGLGATTDGEPLGLSPGTSDDPEDWSHG